MKWLSQFENSRFFSNLGYMLVINLIIMLFPLAWLVHLYLDDLSVRKAALAQSVQSVQLLSHLGQLHYEMIVQPKPLSGVEEGEAEAVSDQVRALLQKRMRQLIEEIDADISDNFVDLLPQWRAVYDVKKREGMGVSLIQIPRFYRAIGDQVRQQIDLSLKDSRFSNTVITILPKIQSSLYELNQSVHTLLYQTVGTEAKVKINKELDNLKRLKIDVDQLMLGVMEQLNEDRSIRPDIIAHIKRYFEEYYMKVDSVLEKKRRLEYIAVLGAEEPFAFPEDQIKPI